MGVLDTPTASRRLHTGTIVAMLEKVLQRNPNHIGAAHYYIHAVEASNDPKRAEPYADKLARSRPAPATWCTCRRTSTSASAATTTPP